MSNLNIETLEKWYKMQEELKVLRDAEAKLRTIIFKEAFPSAKEGTNKVELTDGYVLSATLPITRKVDIAAFEAMKELLAENNISSDKMVKWNPELDLKQYRCLDPEEVMIVDQFLIIKEGSPQLKIVLPAASKKQGFEG